MTGSTILARAGAIGFFINLVLHTMATGAVRTNALRASADLGALVTLLWLLFSVVMLVLGVIVWVHARPASAHRRTVLALAAIFPLATAIGQLITFGPIFPVATLALTASLTFGAAFGTPASPRTPA